MPVAVVLGTAVLVAAAAALLSRWAGRIAQRTSRWTSPAALAALGAVGGAGGAWVASSAVELVTFAAFALGCALLVALDLACHRLPDVISGPTAVVLIAGLAVTALRSGAWPDLGRALLAGLVLGALFLVLALVSPSSMGLGDVKLAALLGIFLGWFGWSTVVTAVVATFLLGGLVALALVLTRRAHGRTQLAFGPWLVLGAVVAAGLAAAAPTP